MMKRGWKFGAVVLLLATALAMNGEIGATEKRMVAHLGAERPYWLHLPKGKTAGQPLPLVIALHGAFTDGKITEGLTGLSELADEKGFVVVYPEANPMGGIGIWDFMAPAVVELDSERMALGRDDVGYVRAMLDALIEEGITDPRRVYATGISNGAMMANRLAVDLGDRIAAIAPVAGTGLKAGAQFAQPKRAMPVIYFHGTEDKIVGVDGTDAFTRKPVSLSAEEFTAWWVEQNGCEPEPVAESLPNRVRNDGAKVERLTWAAGEKKAPVIFYRVDGGGHTWPGGSETQPEEVLGKVCRDINASALIWDFFTRFRLPATAE